MKKTTSVASVLTTNCTIIESVANAQTILEVFSRFPNRFLPVVEGLQFVGIILRDEFMRQYQTGRQYNLTAKDLISKEMVKLNIKNTLEDAKEIFDTNVFELLPVTDDEGDLVGIVLRNELEEAYHDATSSSLLDRVAFFRRSFSLFSW